jgi:hypothetical protein
MKGNGQKERDGRKEGRRKMEGKGAKGRKVKEGGGEKEVKEGGTVK